MSGLQDCKFHLEAASAYRSIARDRADALLLRCRATSLRVAIGSSIDNVVNQALSYLKWLKSQKNEFLLELISDKLGADIASSIELDWSNPRVICVAMSYSKFDIDTFEVVPLRIELMRYRF